MSRVKIIIAAIMFFVITVLKLAFPAVASEMKSVIVPQIQVDTNFREAMIDLGERITGNDGIVSALGQFYRKIPITETNEDDGGGEQMEISSAVLAEPGKDKVFLQNAPRPATTPAPGLGSETEFPGALSPESAPEAIPELTPEPTPEVTVQPEVITVFLESQSEYAGYEKPNNVTYEMPEIPFEYTCPAGGFNSSGFGFRRHPLEEKIKFHYGTDIAAYYGTDIQAFGDGTVLVAGNSDSYGRYIIIGHADGFSTLYAHCSVLFVESGDSVEKEQVIAQVGDTGVVTGAHLHFELLRDNIYINPEYYI